MKDAKTKTLIAFTVVLGLHFINLILGRIINNYEGYVLSWILLASYGPLIFLYTKFFTGRFKTGYWFYLIVPLYPLILWVFTDKLHRESSADTYIDTWASLPIYGSLLVLLILSLLSIKNHKNSSNSRWLYYLIFSFLVITSFHLIVLFSYSSGKTLIAQLLNIFESLYILFFVTGMVYTAMSHPSMFVDLKSIKDVILHPNKYVYNGLSEEETIKIIEKVNLYMTEEMPYLDSELKLSVLSNEIGINKRFISQAINEREKQNFNEYVNSYRVDHAIEILNDAKRDIRIFEVMYEVGFNSKSSFNTSFKRITGQTPTEYRNKVLSDAGMTSNVG